MPEERKKSRRVRHDIVSEILETALQGARKTHIMYKTNLSYFQLIDYLSAMKKSNLIKEESGIWQTTESGKKVIDACKACKNLMGQLDLADKKAPRKKV